MSQFFPSGGQSIRVSASALVFQSYSGLIFFRMNWLDLLEVQGTLESLPQHHSSKASILQQSAFFIVQLSHPCMNTGKNIALTRRTFIGKVMSLFFLICCHCPQYYTKLDTIERLTFSHFFTHMHIYIQLSKSVFFIFSIY